MRLVVGKGRWYSAMRIVNRLEMELRVPVSAVCVAGLAGDRLGNSLSRAASGIERGLTLASGLRVVAATPASLV